MAATKKSTASATTSASKKSDHPTVSVNSLYM